MLAARTSVGSVVHEDGLSFICHEILVTTSFTGNSQQVLIF